ncbi:MAG: F0F1 ATP synthase subunit delta, partial [Clostridia bacterium]|nr:F0F1 ATP synthase subunit delta [Clostridia bacterium]
CFTEFRRLYREDHGIAVAKVVSARPLSDGEKTKLVAALARRYDVKVEAEYKVDPALLGGMKVEISGMLLDGTARRRLDGVRADLSALTL